MSYDVIFFTLNPVTSNVSKLLRSRERNLVDLCSSLNIDTCFLGT